jgi:S1-C subfamily serine protease
VTRISRGVLAVAAVLALVLAACSSGGSGKSAKRASGSSTSTSSSNSAQVPAAQPGIPAIVQKLSPSVVTIITDQGLGSGVVWNADGTIVTDDHVIANATQLTVAFADGRRVPGHVVAGDPVTDLAVVKADRTGLPAAQFETALPHVGALAIAIGSPLGFQNTVSAGVVSGLQRSIPGSAQQTRSLVNLIQTDAAISPGDSGGALVDGNGKVIGLNEAYLPPSTGAVSIGFAIPAETVSDIVPQLLKNGKAVHPFFGVQIADLTPDIAQQFGLKASQGVVVLDVVGGSPAAQAGIQAGDVITQVDTTPVNTVEDFIGALRPHQPGDSVLTTVVRGGSTMRIKVTLTDQS